MVLGMEPPCKGPDPGLSWAKQTNFTETPPAPALPEFGPELFIIQMTAPSLKGTGGMLEICDFSIMSLANKVIACQSCRFH